MGNSSENSFDGENLTIDGKPISEDSLHVLYAIGRQDKPTRSQIASGLSRVGIDAESRAMIIDQLEERGLIVQSRALGIGRRGRKTVTLSLTISGGVIYVAAFGENPVQAGSA